MVIIGPLNIQQEGLLCSIENAEMQIDKTKLGTGALYITENSLCWKKNGNEDGISIPWRKISVHAISTTPQRCVYLMLDFLLIWPGITDQRNGNGHAAPEIQNGDDDIDEDEGHVEDEDHEMSEIWIFPPNVNDVDKIYGTMAECQVLHPDTDNILSDDDDDDEGQEFMDAYEDGGEVGEDDMENLTIDDENRFADANED